MLEAADTFFIASTGGEYGVDVSHRGGPPGFVGVEGATLTVPDYQGNRYFNTLGNLMLDPRAALLVVGFDSGDVLELRGRAEIVWDPQPSAAGGVMAARSESARATISTLPSSSVRFDSTTASAPSASRTRRSASRLVAPVNLRMFKRNPRCR